MRRPALRPLAVGVVALTAAAALVWLIAAQGPLAPVRVTVATAAAATLQPSVFAIGTVEARRSYAVGPTAAGRVARVLVDHGDTVAAGQLLAEMEPVDLDQRLAAASAAAARAGHEVRAAEAARAEAGDRARVATATAERFAELQRRGFVSADAAELRRHEAAAATAGLRAAEAGLAAAGDEARRAGAERSAGERARQHLELRSPVAGVVVARLAEPGSTLVAGQALVQVVDPASLWVRARVDQGRGGGLRVGQPAAVVLRSRPATPLAGRVERLDLVGDAVTEERVANIAFTSPPDGLVIGELAELTVQLPPVQAAASVPAAAVRHLGGRDGVWQIDGDGRSRFQAVRVGVTSPDGRSEIRDGLAAGDRVIVHSARPLAAGQRLREVAELPRATP